MALKICRLAVRGRFDSLTDAARAALGTAVDEHDVVTSGGFTDAGTLSYDAHLDFFSFRVQLRSTSEDWHDELVEEATGRALEAIGAFGATARSVKVTVTDLADVWR